MPYVIEEQLVPTIEGLKKHWETHLPLMQSMAKTQEITQSTLLEMKDAIKELRNTMKGSNKYEK